MPGMGRRPGTTFWDQFSHWRPPESDHTRPSGRHDQKAVSADNAVSRSAVSAVRTGTEVLQGREADGKNCAGMNLYVLENRPSRRSSVDECLWHSDRSLGLRPT